MCESIPLKWSLGVTDSFENAPNEWMPASVPGTIQQDISEYFRLEPLYVNDTVRFFDKYEDMYAIYRAKLPDGIKREHLVLEGKGIDYEYRIRLNNTVLYENEGMFTPFNITLDRGWKDFDNTLYIEILPPPKKAGKNGRAQAVDCCKPPVCYGWDFHPRLVVRGIWNDLRLVYREKPYLKNVRVKATLSADMLKGYICVQFLADGDIQGNTSWKIKLLDPDGKVLVSKKDTLLNKAAECRLEVNNPRLWWPNEYGEQALYKVNIILNDDNECLDYYTVSRGFRRIRLVGELNYQPFSVQFPQTRELPNLTFEINGLPIFAKGTNWVCPTLFPSQLNRKLYTEQLELIKNAHMNIVRCWGGAVVNKTEFFELCDEMGLLVWQEFPLSCNCYTDDPHYLEVLDRESESIIRLIRDHACLALWCGGNELYNFWSGMNDQSLPIRLLNKNCFLLNPETPFLPTSPIMGMAHGTYVFLNNKGQDVFQIMNSMHYRAYTEFGCPGAAEPSLVRKMIPEDEWDNVDLGGAWELHHAVNSWSSDSWLMLPVIQKYFPNAVTTAEQLEYSRLLQGIGYQAMFEEARRQAPHCSMALNWCFNEPWPTAANNSLISGDSSIKPAYYYVCRALRANIVSVRFERFDYKAGDLLKAECFILMDFPKPVKGEIRLTLIQNGNLLDKAELPVNLESPQTSNRIDTCFLKTEGLQSGIFKVETAFYEFESELASLDIEASYYQLLFNNLK